MVLNRQHNANVKSDYHAAGTTYNKQSNLKEKIMSKVKMTIKNATVIYAREQDGKTNLSATITEDQKQAITEKIISVFGADAAADAKWIPAKDSDTNGTYVKTLTSYPVEFYEDGGESDLVSSVDELGKGAVIDLAISIGETRYRRDSGFTAYLTAVNIHKFGVIENKNPFLDDAE